MSQGSSTKTATKTAVSKSSKLTKEEERLLLENSTEISSTASAVFYINAFLVAAIPTWYFYRVQMMELFFYLPIFLVISVANCWLLANAYRNWRFVLHHKIGGKIEHIVSKEVMRKLEAAGKSKSASRQEKEERVSLRKNQVADSQATTFSIFYNNVFFFVIFFIFSCVFLRNNSPLMNYVVSTAGAAVIVWLLSTGATVQKR